MSEHTTLEDQLREAFATRANRTTVTEMDWSERARVIDLEPERHRRRVLVPVLAAAAMALVVGTATFAIARRNENGSVVAGDTASTVPLTADPSAAIEELARPMRFEGAPIVRYGVEAEAPEGSTLGLRCDAYRIEPDAVVCTEVGGFFQSSGDGIFVATALGADAETSRSVVSEPTPLAFDGGTAMIQRRTRSDATASSIPILVNTALEEDAMFVTGYWEPAPERVVAFQMTDRSDADVAATLNGLVAQAMTVDRLPIVALRAGTEVLTVEVLDGKLCYSVGIGGDECNLVGGSDNAYIGIPEGMSTSLPYGWVASDAGGVSVVFENGERLDTVLGPELPGGYRLWMATRPGGLDVPPEDLGTLTITLLDATDGSAVASIDVGTGILPNDETYPTYLSPDTLAPQN